MKNIIKKLTRGEARERLARRAWLVGIEEKEDDVSTLGEPARDLLKIVAPIRNSSITFATIH